MASGVERARVLITVKTYPATSEADGEVTAVAGVRLDRGAPSWIRLYPMRFRTVEEYSRFQKYDIVDVDIRRDSERDPRPESYRPDARSLTVAGSVKADGRQWNKRREIIGPLIGATSACQLLRPNSLGRTGGEAAPSMGLVKPYVDGVTVEHGSPWASRHLAKIEAVSTPSLFGDEIALMEPMPFRLSYRYRCTDGACRGHEQLCLDWELGQDGRALIRDYGAEEAGRRLREKWEREMCDPGRDLYFFIGNHAGRRRQFDVLGTWHPRMPANVSPDQLTLL